MVLEKQSAVELGATEFITKPFKNAELLSVVYSILSPPIAASSNAVEKLEFCKVGIDEFVTRPKIEFDVYIKLSNRKTVKVTNKDEELPKDRIPC